MSGVSDDGASMNGTDGLFSAMDTGVRAAVVHTRALTAGVAFVKAGRKDETNAIVMVVVLLEVCIEC